MTELLFDNLNVLKTDLTEAYNTYGSLKKIPVKLDNVVLEYLIDAYVAGVEDINEYFGMEIEPTFESLKASLFKKVAGKDFRQRVEEYVVDGGTVEDIMRVVETDTTRIYNEASLDAAKKAGAQYKTWNTMADDRVRDTHWPLESITIPIDAWFYSWDGDKAQAPGGFANPENVINCRCWLTFS